MESGTQTNGITLWNILFTYVVVADIVGAFIGGLLNKLRRPRPDLDPATLVGPAFVVPPPLLPVAVDGTLPFLPLYRVLRVLFLNLTLRSSGRHTVAIVVVVVNSLFTFLLFFMKQSLHKC